MSPLDNRDGQKRAQTQRVSAIEKDRALLTRHVLTALITLVLALTLSGCRLPLMEGPISRSLASCRRHSQRGVAAMERQQWAEAEKSLEQAVEACSADPEARRHYAEALWRRDKPTEAVAQLEQASRLTPDDAVVYVRLAEMRLAMDQVDQARRAAEQAIDLEPKRSSAWAVRGQILHSIGRRRQALADYHRALGLAPDDRTLLLRVAELYRELNQPERALAALHRLADVWAPDEEPQQIDYLKGLAYSALGRPQEAAESYAAAAARAAPTLEILHQLARAEMLAGRPNRAAEAARDALNLDPRHEPSRRLLDQLRLAALPSQVTNNR